MIVLKMTWIATLGALTQNCTQVIPLCTCEMSAFVSLCLCTQTGIFLLQLMGF